MKKQLRIGVVIGTRPEVIKQVPLFWALKEVFSDHVVELVASGQHRELLCQALDHFGVSPDVDLEAMKPEQDLNSLSSIVIQGFNNWLRSSRPDLVIVQGDTTTAAMSALASFHLKIKVAHNEAGLRSFNLEHPFPEEANRKWISAIAQFNFAPTENAKKNLLAEGVAAQNIFVSGNTGIDSLLWTLEKSCPKNIANLVDDLSHKNLRPVLITAHRRENKGEVMEEWFKVLAHFLEKDPRFVLVFNSHPNNLATGPFNSHLANHPRVLGFPAMDYLSTCHLLKRCHFVVTDSGGIQEEAATLGVPTVICRSTTERPEGIDAGIARLAGNLHHQLTQSLEWAANYHQRYERPRNIYGDGKSSQRIATYLKSHFL